MATRHAQPQQRSWAASLLALAFPCALPLTFGPWTAAHSQEQAAQVLPAEVVTASRQPTRSDTLVSDVQVLNRDDLLSLGNGSLLDALQKLAGVSFNQYGGLGKQASVNLRGANNSHTLLLIDGVPFSSASAGAPVWDNLPLELIERVEVLRGPASSLYGSSAMGGVIQILTRQGVTGTRPYASLSLGSNDFRRLSAGVQGSTEQLRYALGVQHLEENSPSSTNPKETWNYNPDRDPFRQQSFSGNFNWQWHRSWSLQGGMLYSRAMNHFDDGPTGDTRDRRISATSYVQLRGVVMPGWRTTVKLGESRDDSHGIEGAWLPSDFTTHQRQISWQNDVNSPIGTVLLALERLEQKLDSSTTYDVSQRTIDALQVGLHGQSDAHTWQFNLRGDRNSQFGQHTTGLIGYGWQLTPQWRLRASYGTAFAAPSFNDLYYPGYSNSKLRPTQSHTSDLGLDWLISPSQKAGLTYFDTHARDLIVWDGIAEKPINAEQSHMQGLRLVYDQKSGAWNWRASVEHLRARNENLNTQLPRRPRQQAQLHIAYALRDDLRLGASWMGAVGTYDDAANQVSISGYGTSDAHVTYQLNRDWSTQLRLNNLGDKRYETAYGYNTPRRSVYLTVRWAGH